MNRNLVALFSRHGPGRVILLEGDRPEDARRIVTQLPKALALDGASPQVWVNITKCGEFYDPRYGEFEITPKLLAEMVSNFDARTYGQDVFLDVSHRPSDGAAGKFVKLAVEGKKLRGLVEFTPYGVDAHKNRGFCYLSAEYSENWKDNEKGDTHGAVLVGAGLTIRPVLKGLDPFQLAECEVPTFVHPDLKVHLQEEIKTMWKDLIARLRKTLGETHKLSEANVTLLCDQAAATLEKVTDKAVGEALVGALENAGKQLAEQIKAGNTGPITLAVNLGSAGLDEAGVKALMERTRVEQDNARRLSEESLTKLRKLLTDTVNAATGLPEADRKELVEAVQDLVTVGMSEDQVKRLATTQIAQGNKLVAARALSSMGYPHQPRGSMHIELIGCGDITALQAEVDKRLFSGMPDRKRYALSEGQQVVGNKDFVEKVLAQFDAIHGPRLVREFKAMKLAAGDGIVSDVSIPVSYERTVIREAMYQMLGLGLCDVGTADFAAVVQIPYSYRDTTAAGRSNTRKYEGQAVARAGVKQAIEEARPIPQKIAFEVSDEMRYLVGNGQINFDLLGEEARNASRIIGEDTELLTWDEHLRASDEQAVVALVDEATAVGDGAKKIFVLDQFPVVRPRKVYDLQGNQVGATLYPIVVKTNAVARAEYDGTNAQAAGVYYSINYNLGEITIVSELGVPTALTNAHAMLCSYSYTTNVAKWDSDLPGGVKIDERYDNFLYTFGLRKVAVEDRSYMANLGLMSGTLRTAIEQARQFGANYKRAGTDLMADGNLGRIKDVPSFRSYAPGLAIGDNRVVICERGTVRFRMNKPWQMGQLENQKDANGRFTGKKEAYGDQFITVMTPTELKKAFTSMVVYGAAARVDR